MATKLKNMKLTSVDLVRAGANQEADICLFKSADPPEAPESPTDEEKNIFKRFIDWIRKNPTEAATEPPDPIEKTDEAPDLEYLYKSALADSLYSIMRDETLTEIEKKDMAEESLSQYSEKIRELNGEEDEEAIEEEVQEEEPEEDQEDENRFDELEEVHKFNQHHGADGKFTSGGGGGGAAPAAGGGAAEHVKTLNGLPTKNGMSKVSYEDIKAYESVLNKMPKGTKLSHKHSGGTDTFERVSDSERGPSWKHTRAPWGKVDNASSFDVGHWLAGRGYISRGPIEIAN